MSETERMVLRVSGPDRRKFLQDLITNDIAGADDGIIYAALLSPQGKFLFDFFVLAQGEAYLVDVARDRAQAFGQRLMMYRLRAAIEIEATEIDVSRGVGPMPQGAFADPRDPCMGWRGYDCGHSEDVDWDAIRVANLVPATQSELRADDSYILEMGFERLSGVDFRKGCYVGQEVTARMKHKTELRKGLARVELDTPVPYGTDITLGSKTVGTVLTVSGMQALAYLRFDRTGDGMTANGARVRHLA